jgi:DNA-binding transcriptional MerR regulator
MNPKQPYSLLSEDDPTDEQLEALMQEVLKEVKQRAAIANERFQALQAQQIREALQKRKERLQNEQ